MVPLAAWPAALALLTGACAGDLTSPFAAVAVTYDAGKHQYKLAQVQVTTLTGSLRHLQGSSGTVRAGGNVRVVEGAVAQKGATVEALRTQFITAAPEEVNLSWSVLNDIVYPEDFPSLELLSGYYNLEKARAAFRDFGLATLPAMPIVAHAAVLDDAGLNPIASGELYYPPLGTFYFPVASAADAQLPLVFNPGAVAHALGHEAVAQLIWAGAPVAAPETGPAKDPQWNSARHVARSMAEGLADYLGVATTGDPRWFDHSEQQRAAQSALDVIRCGTPDMLQALPVDDGVAPYDPYPLGTVLAGALWEASQGSGVQTIAKGVLAALPDIGTRVSADASQLNVALVLDALAKAAAPEQQNELCGLFLNRFAKLSVMSLPSCSAPVPHQECQ
jgi:hypothetical protein